MKKILLHFVFNNIFLLAAAQPVPTQNVGIGISNPTRAKLEVHAEAGTTSAIFGGEVTGISLRGNFPTLGYNEYYNAALGNKYIANGFAANQYLNTSTGVMGFAMIPSGIANATISGRTDALMIANNGNVGMRTNPTNASLFAIKAGNPEGSVIFGGTSYGSYFHYSSLEDTYIRGGKPGSIVFINDIPSGRTIIGSGTTLVGINTANPVYPLEIRQTGATGIILVAPDQAFNNWEHVVGLFNAGPQSSLKMLYNGQLKCFFRPTDGEFITSSDLRLKTNIRPLPQLLEKIMQLRPVEYEMKYDNPNHEKSIGFIAQEVNRLFPEMVSVLPNTITKGVSVDDFHVLNYNGFKILAVKAVQEEQKLILDLQNRQDEISRLLEAVEKKLSLKNSEKKSSL